MIAIIICSITMFGVVDLFAAIPIKGKVTSLTDNIPMGGVSVFVKGSTNGTTTDADGIYVISAQENDILVFSFIGCKPQEVPVNGRTVINITLEQEVTLNEVVVDAGYYSTTETMKTGSIVKVTAKDIERQPVTSPLMALQGRVPGLDITPNNGVPGSAISVEIRGQNTTRPGSSYPLYIIDGIPIDSRPIASNNQSMLQDKGFDPLSTINPANILSIEVLKDADATAIYGSRGANGVILISTKRGGQTDKTNIDVSAYSGVGRISNTLQLMNTQQYLSIRREAYRNANETPALYNAADLLVWDTTRYTDWQKELLGGNATVNDVQFNISSGNKNTSFRFGAGYHKERMIVPGNFGFTRASGNVSINHTSVNQKFQFTLTTNYGLNFNKLTAGSDMMTRALTLPPNAPSLYDENGELNWEKSTWINPLAALRKTDDSESNNIIANSTISYAIVPGLSAKVNLGYNALNSSSIAKEKPFSSMDPAQINDYTTATSVFENTQRSSWLIEPQMIYGKRKDNHDINIVIGATLQEARSAHQLAEATGYTSDVLLESLLGATKVDYRQDNDSEYRYAAVFGRIGYILNDKYIVNLTGRRDGSSRFGPGKRWGNFGAIGGAWIFSRESFMETLPFISFGKLRGTYGITGSDQIGEYQFLSTYRYMDFLYQGQVSLTPNGLANPKYAWEETTKLESSIELGFFKDRVSIEITRYQNRCANQLLQYQLPGAAGFPGVTQNLRATVENRGWEFVLNTVNVIARDFKWTSSINLSIPKNELLKYPGLRQSSYANQYEIGKPINIIKLFNYTGVNPTTGLYQVQDLDQNGTFDYRDATFIQDLNRKYYGGFVNTVSYKGFELSALLQYSKQVKVGISYVSAGYGMENLPVDILNSYWKNDGDVAKYQKITRNFMDAIFPPYYINNSNAVYVDNSFIRLKTLTLSYRLSENVMEKLRLKSAKIYIQGQNLATITRYKAIDPETRNAMPPLRMFTGGIEIQL